MHAASCLVTYQRLISMTSLSHANFATDDVNEVREICRRTKPRTDSESVKEAVTSKNHAQLDSDERGRPPLHGGTLGEGSEPSLCLPTHLRIPLPPPIMHPSTTPDGANKPHRSPTTYPHVAEGTKLVKPHEKAVPWDDHPRYDLTYQNPNYFQPIENILWLPVNPHAVLDSDDTLDLLRAITSEPGAGALGHWVNEITSALQETPGSSIESLELREVEDVHMEQDRPVAAPHTPADRGHDEADDTSTPFKLGQIQTQMQAAITSEPLSSPTGLPTGQRISEDVAANSILHHPTALRRTSSRLSNHSLHHNPVTPVSLGLPNLSSHSLSTPQNLSRLYGASSVNRTSHFRSGSAASSQCSFRAFNPPAHVDLGSQMRFADPNSNLHLRRPSQRAGTSAEKPPLVAGLERGRLSVLSVPETRLGGSGVRRTGSQLSVTSTGRARSQSRLILSTAEAVMGEVLEEERIATAIRIKKETTQGKQANTPRPWLKSLLYDTPEVDEDLPEILELAAASS